MEELKFIEETHTYVKNGKTLKSVTQILQELFPEKYENVPKDILESKAKYGTELHKYIEMIEKKKPKDPIAYIKRKYKPSIYQIESLKQYLKIKNDYDIKITDSEKKVSYKNFYAGTLDLKGYVGKKSAIIDVKTTYEYDEAWVTWQNSLYELASGKVNALYCLWLPKAQSGKLYKLERVDKKLLKILIGEKNRKD